jgi:hypothetical protein
MTHETGSAFASEMAMSDAIERAATSIFCAHEETWVLVNEHRIHSRIPDLVVARIDVDALEQRLRGGWGRPLGSTELRALRALRPDRAATLESVARQIGVSVVRTRPILNRLVSEAFAERTPTGTYARRAPIRLVVDRVITIEAKRSDLGRAFSQARAHSVFADISVVAFDLAYRRRAAGIREAYAREGIGLLGVSASDESWTYIVRPRKSPLIAALGRAIAAERTFERLLGPPLRQLPETRLPNGSRLNGGPSAPQLLGSGSTKLAQLLPGCVPR